MNIPFKSLLIYHILLTKEFVGFDLNNANTVLCAILISMKRYTVFIRRVILYTKCLNSEDQCMCRFKKENFASVRFILLSSPFF